MVFTILMFRIFIMDYIGWPLRFLKNGTIQVGSFIYHFFLLFTCKSFFFSLSFTWSSFHFVFFLKVYSYVCIFICGSIFYFHLEVPFTFFLVLHLFLLYFFPKFIICSYFFLLEFFMLFFFFFKFVLQFLLVLHRFFGSCFFKHV
jgi:hypothetical protein